MKKYILFPLLFISVSNAWSQTPSWLWAENALPIYSGIGSGGIATDPQGNVYVTGYFADLTITFGDSVLYNANTNINQLSNDIFIVKYDPSGNVLWARRDGGVNDELATGMALDAAGNIYVTGYFYSDATSGLDTAIFGATILVNDSSDQLNDMFLVKYDNNGHELWARGAGGDGNDGGSGLACDQLGNIYVIGSSTSDSIAFGTFELDTAVMFLVKYDSTGNVIWARRGGGDMGSQGYDQVSSVVADKSNNVYIAGGFLSDSISFGPFTLYNANAGNQTAPFLLKCDTGGAALWAKAGVSYPPQFVIDYDQVFSIVTDASGNVFTAGAFGSDSVRFANSSLVNPHTSYGKADAFLLKWDANGNVLWADNVQSTSADGDVPYSIATDNTGSVYMGGYFDESDTLQFGTSVSVSSLCSSSLGSIDMFFAKYDGSGNALWAQQASGKSCPGVDICNSIATDLNGNVYSIGTFTGDTLDLGTTTLMNQPDSITSFFIAKLGSTINGIQKVKASAAGISIYPNPAKDAFTIVLNNDIQNGRLEVCDMLGHNIFTEEFNNYYSGNNKYVQMSVPAGVYLARVTDGLSQYTAKVVITP